ncbi:MAG: hypothetical protein CL679_11510 [Bermanella sp.]|nr:hypothetical protein [Bermanella sp.]
MSYLLVLTVYFHGAVLVALCPLFIVQSIYIRKLWRGKFIFCRPRQWQFFNGQARVKLTQDWQSVDVVAHQVWPSCVIIRYRENDINAAGKRPRWQWDIVMFDACEHESFRQFIALMRCEYQAKEV